MTQKSLVILVDNERQCQLFYRSRSPPRLLSFVSLGRFRNPATQKAKGHGSFPPVALEVLIATGSSPPRGTRCRVTSRMLRAGPAAPAASGLTAARATSSLARGGVYALAPTRSSARASAAPRVLGRRPEHEPLDRDEVVEHRLPRRGGIASRDRLEYPAMVLVRACGPARGVEGLLAALGQEVHDRVRDPRDRSVVRGGADRGVEGGVLREAGLPRRDLPGLVLEDPFHLVDLFRRRPAGGQGGDGRLEDPPGFEELADGLTLRRHHEGQRADQRVEGHLADEGALARTDLDEAQAFERSQGFAHGGAADDEFFGELPLGREPIAALEATFRDQLLDLADDLLVDPRRLDRPELDGRVRRLTSRFPAPGLAHRRLTAAQARGRGGGAARAPSRAL